MTKGAMLAILMGVVLAWEGGTTPRTLVSGIIGNIISCYLLRLVCRIPVVTLFPGTPVVVATVEVAATNAVIISASNTTTKQLALHPPKSLMMFWVGFVIKLPWPHDENYISVDIIDNI